MKKRNEKLIKQNKAIKLLISLSTKDLCDLVKNYYPSISIDRCINNIDQSKKMLQQYAIYILQQKTIITIQELRSYAIRNSVIPDEIFMLLDKVSISNPDLLSLISL